MPISPETFLPYGDYDEFADNPEILAATVDGVEYLTDRRILIRADLVTPRPSQSHMHKMRPGDTKAVEDFVALILKAKPIAEPDLSRKLAPVYVADVEDSGLSLVPSARVWLIQRDGKSVGCCAPLTERGGFDGILPGEIRPEHRNVYEILQGVTFDRWHAWNATFETVDAVKAASSDTPSA